MQKIIGGNKMEINILPKTLDSFWNTGGKGAEKYLVEYDGWHFEGATKKSCVNKVLKYIFAKEGK